MKKSLDVYCCREEGNFYLVKETLKTFKINWIEQKNCDGSFLDQTVKYKELVVKKDNKGIHCLKDWEIGDENLLIYPRRSGQPFYLTPITIGDIEKEIKDCEKWGVSSQYYKNLKIFTWQGKSMDTKTGDNSNTK